MNKDTAIKLFESKKIRSVWDEDLEKWYFSIVDVVSVLTESPNPNNYWKVLKHRLVKEGSELVTDCNQLKMQSSDGKYYHFSKQRTKKSVNKLLSEIIALPALDSACMSPFALSLFAPLFIKNNNLT